VPESGRAAENGHTISRLLLLLQLQQKQKQKQ
jgi:hypothetical protein